MTRAPRRRTASWSTKRPARAWRRAICSSLGHESVVHLRGPHGWLEADARVRGWRSELEAAGVQVPETPAGDWTPASGYRAGLHLARMPELTAVFSANDQMALGLISALHEAGRAVPDDVSVIGFDDIPEAGYFHPPLTTIRQDFAEVGRRCIARLDGADRRRAGHLDVRRSSRRSSCGPAPARHPRPARAGRRECSPQRRDAMTGIPRRRVRGRCRLRHAVRTGGGRAGARRRRARKRGPRLRPWRHGPRACLDRRAAATGLGPAGPGRLRRRPATRGPGRARRERSTAAGRDRDRDGLHRLHGAACARRRHAAVRAARSSPTGRTPTSSCGSTTQRRATPTGSTHWPPNAASPGWRGTAARSAPEWEFAKGLQLLEEDPEVYERMDRWVEAADWIVWQLCGTLRPQRLHGRLQGHLPGRRLPERGVPRCAQPRLRRLRARQARSADRRAGRPRRSIDRRGGCAGPGFPKASRSASAMSTPT